MAGRITRLGRGDGNRCGWLPAWLPLPQAFQRRFPRQGTPILPRLKTCLKLFGGTGTVSHTGGQQAVAKQVAGAQDAAQSCGDGDQAGPIMA